MRLDDEILKESDKAGEYYQRSIIIELLLDIRFLLNKNVDKNL